MKFLFFSKESEKLMMSMNEVSQQFVEMKYIIVREPCMVKHISPTVIEAFVTLFDLNGNWDDHR